MLFVFALLKKSFLPFHIRTRTPQIALVFIALPPGQAALQSQIMQYDQVRQNVSDRQQRYEDESNLRRARADVERQKKFLQQREYEEQSARARRDANARYGR